MVSATNLKDKHMLALKNMTTLPMKLNTSQSVSYKWIYFKYHMSLNTIYYYSYMFPLCLNIDLHQHQYNYLNIVSVFQYLQYTSMCFPTFVTFAAAVLTDTIHKIFTANLIF